MSHHQIAEIELSYHSKLPVSELPSITSADDAYQLFLDYWDKGKLDLQEQFKVLLLDQKASCLGISTIATGGISNCLVDLKLVFALALKAKASSIILAHNHPSGNKKPSPNDRVFTGQMSAAGKLLDISVLDHLIITSQGYTSLAYEGLMNCKA